MNARDDGERYLVDKKGPADPEVERLEHLLGRFSLAGSPRAEEPARPYMVAPRTLRIALAAAAVFVALTLLVRELVPARGSWAVRGLPGVERLARGGWLETSGDGVALVVGTVGEVELAAGTRVRLDDEGRDVHALYLERGAVHATITARPREFQIGTPAGVSIDLGCVYDLAVDADGASTLAVITGQVAFEAAGRTAFVPAGYETRVAPGAGPLVPLALGGPPEVAAWVRRVERAERVAPDDLAAVDRVVDSVVLFHLVRAASVELREAALDLLVEREGLPAGRTRAELLTDDAAWDAWHEDVLGTAFRRR